MDRPAPTCRPHRRSDVAWVEVDGEAVAVDHLDRVHLLSATGALLWTLFDGDTSLQRLAEDVSVTFGVDLQVALNEISEFAAQMEHLHLIETGAPLRRRDQ